MRGKTFDLKSWVVFVALSALSLGHVPAQTCTPGQILQCDPGGSGTPVDSVIFQDADGNIGIGTTTPTAKLHVARGHVQFDDSTATAGNILKGGVLFLHNYRSGAA